MIAYRHSDPRFPFLWESPTQPAARWHAQGDGPAQYLAGTPDAAWAEFLRHEAISEPDDVAGVSRSLWAVELDESELVAARVPRRVATGGLSSYPACQAAARRLRSRGVTALRVPSAALEARTSSGWRVERGLQPGPRRAEWTIVLYGPRPQLVGWACADRGRPRADLLARVRPLAP